MKSYKLTKEDVINYRHELLLTSVYTIILCLVYGVWTFETIEPLWATFLVVIVFVLLGIAFYYFWVLSLKKRALKEE